MQPQGYAIPARATRIHGITTERATAEGVPLSDALRELSAAAAGCSLAVAHNLAFDERVLGAEFLRSRLPNPLQPLERVCTMLASTDLCRIPGPYGYKWPTLEERHRHLFAESPRDAHDAAADARSCARCFFELRHRQQIQLRAPARISRER